jgi:hypothetical protein
VGKWAAPQCRGVEATLSVHWEDDKQAPPDFDFPRLSTVYNNSQRRNLKIHSSPASNIMRLIEKVKGMKVNDFPFWPNFKFPQDCKLQILEIIQIEILLEF